MNKLSCGETISPPPRRSRRIYVHAETDPQSAQLWWPGRGAVCIAGPGGTDRWTDRRIVALLDAPLQLGA